MKERTKQVVLNIEDISRDKLTTKDRYYKIEESCWWNNNVEDFKNSKKALVSMSLKDEEWIVSDVKHSRFYSRFLYNILNLFKVEV